MTTAGMSSSVHSNAGPRRRMSRFSAVIVSASRSKVISPRAFVKRALGGEPAAKSGQMPQQGSKWRQQGQGRATYQSPFGQPAPKQYATQATSE